MLDLSNKLFGAWLVTDYSHKKGFNHYWNCKCICGIEKQVSGNSLLNNKSKSCGCLGKPLQIDLIGKKFGRLTVIKFIGKNGRHKNNGRYKYFWECNCDCGESIVVLGKNLKSGGVKSCGCLFTDFAKFHKKENHWNWNINKTTEDRNRATLENINWRKSVFERDNYTCQISGIKKNLQAHHILNWADNKEFRFDINNGVTLHKTIHNLFHKLYGRGNNTKEQFEEFKTRYNSGEFS